MSHQALTALVAFATGESRRTIARRGFSLADPETVAYDPEPDADERDELDRYLDWDAAAPRW